MKELTRKLNIRYGAIHGAYWMFYGVICSFASVFLLDKGFSNSQIGIILALGDIIAVVVQPVLADIADRSRRFTVFNMMELMILLLAVATLLLLIIPNKGAALAISYVLGFAIMMILQPFCNAVNGTLEQTGVKISFGICRAVGSGLYAILVAILGNIVEARGTHVIPIAGLLVIAFFLLVILDTSRAWKKSLSTKPLAGGLANQNAPEEAAQEIEEIDLKQFMKRHRLFIVCSIGIMGVYFGNAIINSYMTQIATNVGGTSSDIGHIFSLLAFMEIPTLVAFDKIAKHFDLNNLLKFSAAAFVLWIGICTVAPNVTVLLLAQFVQPFSFALFLPAMVRFIDTTMSRGEAIKGHTLFTTMTTVAAIFSSGVGGIIIDASSPRVLTGIGTIVTALGALIIFFFIGKAREEGERMKGNL